MRDIKFRIWETLNKKMTPWDKLQNAQISILNRPESIVKDEFVVMQYTGLTDKNGKEIYEGDILKDEINGEIHKIVWDESEARFEAVIIGGVFSDMKRHIPDVKIMEIKGNIYENPELIK